jgi:signal transduction histidine kinase
MVFPSAGQRDDSIHERSLHLPVLRQIEPEPVVLVAGDAQTAQPIIRALKSTEYRLALSTFEPGWERGLEPIAIILDLTNRAMNGIEMARWLRADARSCEIPILFVIDPESNSATLFEAFGSGPVDCVVAPFEPVVLRAKVRLFFVLHQKTKALKASAMIQHRTMMSSLTDMSFDNDASLLRKRQGAYHALMLKALPIAFYSATLDDPRRLFFSDDKVFGMTGRPASEFLSGSAYWSSCVHAADRDRVFAALTARQRTDTLVIDYRVVDAQGADRHIVDHSAVSRDSCSDAQLLGFWLDITERKRLEFDMQQVRKYEAVGQMTGGIAHDVNNMLGIIIGSLSMAKGALDSKEAAAARLHNAIDGVHHCAQLTRRLMNFTQNRDTEASVVELGKFLPDMAEFIDIAVTSRVHVTIVTQPNLWPVRVDATQLQAALVNLAINARDAMPNGGNLSIRAVNRPLTEQVMIEITDTGSGMPPDVLSRVFQPYFSTKAPHKGTGLGLPMVRQFAKDAGGSIDIESTPGKGTTVRVMIPRAP